jgi:O-antigen ligase
VVGFLLVLPVAYGLCVSFARGEIVPGATAAADWVGPLLYYFFVIAHWRRIGEAEAPFQGFLAINGAVMIGYGLYQYLSPPPWDVDWVLNSGMISSIGHPLPGQVRIFGTLNAPGILAFWLGAILLLCLHFRSLLTVFIVPVGAVVLALTLVRSVVGTVVMGLALAGALGRASTFKVLAATLVAVVVVLGGLSAVDPEMAAHLTKRFSTLNNLEKDESALAREDLYRRTPAMIAANPLGVGIGGIGRGAVASNNAEMVTIDSGLLATYLALGWFGGSIYLAGLGLALLQALLAARITRSPVALALAVTATATAANIVFTNITSFFATTIWLCSAYAAAIGIQAREQPATPHGGSMP